MAPPYSSTDYDTISNLDTTLLTTLTNRIMALEQTAIIRSFDTLVSPISGFSIPVDLVESESLKINVNILVGGTGSQNVYLKYNTASGTNLNWPNFSGNGDNGTNGNNGLIAASPASGQTLNVEIDLYRSFDVNTTSQRYYMKACSLSFWSVSSPAGLLRLDCQGAVESIITGLHFSVAAGTTLKASYSITKDQRRTAQNGALL